MFSALYSRSWSSETEFKRNVNGSQYLLDRLCQTGTLRGHSGCVNTVSFCHGGSRIISGSDDTLIKLWDTDTGEEVASIDSGHTGNVFQARAKPEMETTILSCAADGQVHLSSLGESGTLVGSRMLGRHKQRAHKLALYPEDPNCFYSCGEDGAVIFYDLRCPHPQALLMCKRPSSHGLRHDPLELYSIHCNPARPWQFVVAGVDPGTRVYDHRTSMTGIDSPPDSAPGGRSTPLVALASPVRNLVPENLKGTRSHVTCAVFSQQAEIISSYDSGKIYRFRDDTGSRSQQRPIPSDSPGQKRVRSNTSLGEQHSKRAASDLSRDAQQPSSSKEQDHPEVAGAMQRTQGATTGQSTVSEDGLAGMCREAPRTTSEGESEQNMGDLSQGALPSRDSGNSGFETAADIETVSEESSDAGTASSSEHDDSSESDIGPVWSDDGMDEGEATDDSDSDSQAKVVKSIILGYDGPPETDNQVLMSYSGHLNMETVKGVSYLGQNDEYVMSGSDCGNIFIWRTDTGQLLAVTKGDEDVVNCLTPHPTAPMSFVSSGIESDAKIWEPTAGEPDPDEQKRASNRRNIQAKRNAERYQSPQHHMSLGDELFLQRFLDLRRYAGVDEDDLDYEEGDFESEDDSDEYG